MNIWSLPGLSLIPSVVTRAPVPDDLDSVTSIRAEAEVDPREVDVDPAALAEIWETVRCLYRSGIHPAIQLCLRREGRVIMDRAIGYAHGAGPDDPPDAPKVPATPDTPFNVFSASKPVAAMMVHLLDEKYLVHLDDPVCEYIPEFGVHGKEWITIRHVLTHRAGIPSLPVEALDIDVLRDTGNRKIMAMLCDSKPDARAGRQLAYHAMSGGFILGEIVKRVTGKSIRTVVDETLCEPLDWRWMNFGVRARDVHRVAASYVTGLPMFPPASTLMQKLVGISMEEAVEASNTPELLQGILPAGNLVTTADEMCQFYQLLLQGGELNGVRVFAPRTVWRATAEQSYGELDHTLGIPLRYGMGFMLGGEWLSLYGLDTGHAFGHIGFTNVVSWADPPRRLAGTLMTSGKPIVYPEIYLTIRLMRLIAQACSTEEGAPAHAGAGSEEGPPLPRPPKPATKSTTKKSTTKKAVPKKAASKPRAPKKAAPKKATTKKAVPKKAAKSKAAKKARPSKPKAKPARRPRPRSKKTSARSRRR